MQNLYDLLGVRPDDDAETIKKAFRKAAKASHPDHHSGDPQAEARFKQISQAYEILGDAERRAAYDWLRESELRPLRHKLKRSLSAMKRDVVQGMMVGVLFIIVLVVGYATEQFVPETSGDRTAGVTARQSAQSAADQPVERVGAAEHDRSERVPGPQMPIVVPTAPAAATAASDHDQPQITNGVPVSNPVAQTVAVTRGDGGSDAPTVAGVPGKTEGEPSIRHANDYDQPQMTDGEPVPNPAGPTVAVARRDGWSEVPARAGIAEQTEGESPIRHANDHDQPEVTSGDPVSESPGRTIAVASQESGSDAPTVAGVPGKTEDEPSIRHDVPSLATPASAKEEGNSVPAADHRRDSKTREPAQANTAGVKLPAVKKSARTLVATKRDTPSHRLQQAALEHSNTPAPDNAPSRVYGVGF
jgi:hypothetical protein